MILAKPLIERHQASGGFDFLFRNGLAKLLLARDLETLYIDLARVFDKRKSLVGYLEQRVKQTAESGSLLYIPYTVMLDRARNGDPLSVVVEGLVPVEHVLLISTGERSKDTAGGLRRIQAVVEVQKKINALIAVNVGPPAVMFLIAAFVLATTYGAKVVPMLAGMLGSMEQIGPTMKLVYHVAEAFKGDSGIILTAGILGSLLAVIVALPNWRSKLRRYAENYLFFPFCAFFIVYRLRAMAINLMVLSAMIKSKETPARACALMAEKSPPYTAAHLIEMAEKFADGQPASVALDTGFFERNLLDRIEIAENDGELNTVMEELSTTYRDDVIRVVNRSTKLIGAILFVALVALVGGVMVDYFGTQDAIESKFN